MALTDILSKLPFADLLELAKPKAIKCGFCSESGGTLVETQKDHYLHRHHLKGSTIPSKLRLYQGHHASGKVRRSKAMSNHMVRKVVPGKCKCGLEVGNLVRHMETNHVGG